jgi:hypothetical protein
MFLLNKHLYFFHLCAAEDACRSLCAAEDHAESQRNFFLVQKTAPTNTVAISHLLAEFGFGLTPEFRPVAVDFQATITSGAPILCRYNPS